MSPPARRGRAVPPLPVREGPGEGGMMGECGAPPLLGVWRLSPDRPGRGRAMESWMSGLRSPNHCCAGIMPA